jgi:hypothetical protein
MTISTEALTASQAFFDSINPAVSLRTGLAEALARGSLKLYFMYTPPPTREECQLGLQVIDPTNDPIALEPFKHVSSGYYLKHYEGQCYTGVGGEVKISPDEWQVAGDAIASITGSAPVVDNNAALSLVPRMPNKTNPLTFSTSWSDRHGVQAGAERVMPYRWAFLADGDSVNTNERLWAKFNNGVSINRYRGGSYLGASHAIFDFRGTIPLTIGEVGSNTNIWLGHQREFVESQNQQAFVYPATVECARIYVPMPV